MQQLVMGLKADDDKMIRENLAVLMMKMLWSFRKKGRGFL